jgi:uroporphyrinogen decarboxylase
MMTGRSPERLPVFANFTPPAVELVRRHTGSDDPVAALGLDFRAVYAVEAKDDPTRWRAAYDQLGWALPPDATVGYCGIAHRIPPRASMGEATHLREMLHPLDRVTDVAQLEQLPWPELTDDDRSRLDAHVGRTRAEGLAAVVSMECTLFEHAWYLRGMDSLFMDLIEGNGVGDWLLDWFTQRSVRAVEMACDAHADVVGLGDDVGTQRGMLMSPDFWREHLKPRLKRVIDAIAARDARLGRKTWVRYHSDGDVRPIVDDLIEIGVDILNPVQPECMPPDEVVPKYAGRVGFWGMIGTQTVMPFGTPEEIEKVVGQCLDWAGGGAAIVVAPTHVLEPDVPWANIKAFVDAAHRARLS